MKLQAHNENWIESILAGAFIFGLMAIGVFFATGGDVVLVDAHLAPASILTGVHHD